MIEQTLRLFADEVADEFPDLKHVLDQAKNGLISEEDALLAMAEVMSANPEMGRRFQRKALAALTPLAEEHRAKPLDHGGLVMHPPRGLPKLNPLFEAALIERAQFDEDMPELRTGPMPPHVRPAVEVDTFVRNPEALGLMLHAASADIHGEVREADENRKKLVQQVVGGDHDGLMALMEKAGSALQPREVADLVLDGKTDLVDAPRYKRGQRAVVKVETPSGSALLALTPAQRQESAWKFLSTTQGRRSAVNGLAELVDVKLQGEGFNVTVRPFQPDPQGFILAAHEWSVRIDGAGSTQSAFNLIDVAAASIAKGLAEKAGPRRGAVYLEVVPVNTVDIRQVGWAGRLIVDKVPALTGS